MKRLIYVIMALAMVMAVLGDIDCYTNQVCRLGDFVYTDAFVEITSRICKISIWYPNETIVVNNADMTNLSTGYHYYEYTPTLTGDYAAEMTCNNSGDVGKLDRSFTVYEDATAAIAGIGVDFKMLGIIFLPAIFGLFALIGAATMNEDHNVLRIGLFMLSIVSVLGSLWLGSVSVGTSDPTMQSAIGTTTKWIGIVFAFVIFYFLIYGFYKMTRAAAQEKEEKMGY